MAGNGTDVVPTVFRSDDLEGADVTTQHQLSALDEKTDDIRTSVSAVVTMQAQLVGKLDVLTTKLEASDKVTDFRLANLEHDRNRTEQRGWVEKLVYGALGLAGGAGAYGALQGIFHLGP